MGLDSAARICPVCDLPIMWTAVQDPPGFWGIVAVEATEPGTGNYQVIETTMPTVDHTDAHMPVDDFPMAREWPGSDYLKHSHQEVP